MIYALDRCCPECGGNQWHKLEHAKSDEHCCCNCGSVYTLEEITAAQFVAAIKTIAAKPENLENLECYLSHHFPEWLQKYANTPETITAELLQFANMEI